MYSFDLSFLVNFLSIDYIWKIVIKLFTWLKGEPLKTNKGNQVFILGSNKFIGCPNILKVDGYPSIRVDTLGEKLYLSADLYDKEGKIIMKIVRNKIKLNSNNLFEIKKWNKDKLAVINQYGELIEIIVHPTGEIELNGVFYYGRTKLNASPNGLQIN